MQAPLSASPRRRAGAVAAAARRVSFAEVNEQVLRRTCWHCHSTPEFAMGDGGPGNTGALAFVPVA